MQRWLVAGCFELLVEDVRSLLCEWGGRKGQPTAVCINSRTLQSTPESGARAGYDGTKRRKGSKVHIADQGDREQVAALAEQVQEVTGGAVALAYVDQGYTGPNAQEAAQQHGLRLEVVKHPMAKRGFVLLPRRWVVERSFAWPPAAASPETMNGSNTTLKGLHLLAFTHPHAQKSRQHPQLKFLTDSRAKIVVPAAECNNRFGRRSAPRRCSTARLRRLGRRNAVLYWTRCNPLCFLPSSINR